MLSSLLPIRARLGALLLLAVVVAFALPDAVRAQRTEGVKPAPAPALGSPSAPSSLEGLLARLTQLKGMRARYREEKRIVLLKRPLVSEGEVRFAAPNLLLRKVERPEPATVLLEGEQLRVADSSGTRNLDLSQSPVVRQLVLTFVHVLSGNREALERLYTLRFEALPAQRWQLTMTPKTSELGKLLTCATLEGHDAVVERLALQERSGDSTTMLFSEVDLTVRYDAAERARIFRLP